jgi:FemAB-related protein (PEP-CTERM system-associated)
MTAVMKQIHIRIAVNPDQQRWDDYVLEHPDGTAYQLFAWGKAIEQAYAFKSCNVLGEIEGKICGLLPLVNMRIPIFGEQLISLPYCDAGGILADNDEIAQALWQKGLELSKEQHCDFQIRANDPLPFAGENRTDKVRMLLELPENSETLLSSFKSKFRNKIKLPSRDGFSARIGAGELLPDFYRIFTENMRDLGSPVHSRKWFQAIADSFQDRMRVAVVYASDGTPAAAGIILLHPHIVANPWASSLSRYDRWKPNMLLYWSFLAFAADNGFKYFDFGRSSVGGGTFNFKEQWGAAPKSLFWYELKIKGEKGPSESNPKGFIEKRQMAATLWSKLPLSVTNWLGPKIRKYISL